MSREDTDHGRFYTIDGVRYPSVTTILQAINKPALVPWAANQERAAVMAAAGDLYQAWAAQAVRPPMPRSAFLSTLDVTLGPVRAHQRQLEAAGDIGSETHKLIEWMIRTRLGAEAGPEPIVSTAAQLAFLEFDAWAASVRFKPILIERTVHSVKHGFAGTTDLLARVDGVLMVVDFKTGKAIYPEAQLQVAAYSVAMFEMGYRPQAALIVRLPKVAGDSLEVQPVSTVAELFPTFLAVKQLWTWQQQQPRPRSARRPTAPTARPGLRVVRRRTVA
jgi:hypothetical protein